MSLWLTKQQKRFCEKYLKCRNVFTAAEHTDIQLSESIREDYYVYFLIEKEWGRIFYVGKGKRNRVQAHFRPDKRVNVAKAAEINKISERGNTPAFVLFAWGLGESHALGVERELIDALGSCDLTNGVRGTSDAMDRTMLETKRILDSIMPFDLWMSLAPRSKRSISNYWFIVNELKKNLSYGRT